MGAFVSSTLNYIDVWKMNTFAEIDFQQELQRQYEVARAAGQQQMLAQVSNVGGMGGGGGFWSSTTPWGGTSSLWLGVNNFFQAVAPAMIFIFVAFMLAAYFARMDPGAMFAAVTMTMLFALMWIQYHTTLGMTYITTARPIFFSILASVIAGLVLTFAWYKPSVFDPAQKTEKLLGEKKATIKISG